LAVAESVQFEQLIALPDSEPSEISQTPVQRRIRELREYLRAKHELD
jgi:hypothetical protein